MIYEINIINNIMFGHILAFIYGFISGFCCNYAYKLYQKYIKFNDVKKTILHEAYLYAAENIFNVVSDDLINHMNKFDISGIQNLNDFKKLVDSSVGITHELNRSFKIRLNDGKIQLKLLNPSYVNNEHFVRLCKFFTDNNVDLHIILNNDINLDNKIEYNIEENNIEKNNIEENNKKVE